MKRTTFRSGFSGKQKSARRFAAGFLVMSMALSASAKEGTPGASASAMPGSVVPRPKNTAKSKHWYEIGIASWYGTKFQGRTTAGGERFDMNRMTCAHRSLPLNTWLRVTNLKNHKTAYVRVNDRGPVADDRIVDLSYAAAQSLGLAGLGQVRLEPVNSNDPVLAQAMLAQLKAPVVALLSLER